MSETTPATVKTPSLEEQLWSTEEVSKYLGVPKATLHQWRYLGTGPVAYRVGRHLRYDPLMVLAWLETRTV